MDEVRGGEKRKSEACFLYDDDLSDEGNKEIRQMRRSDIESIYYPFKTLEHSFLLQRMDRSATL